MTERFSYLIFVFFISSSILLGSCETPKQVSISHITDTLYIHNTDTVIVTKTDTVTNIITNTITNTDSTVIKEYIDSLGVKNREVNHYKQQIKELSTSNVESHNQSASETSSNVTNHVSNNEQQTTTIIEEKPTFFQSLFQKVQSTIFFIIWSVVIALIAYYSRSIIPLIKKLLLLIKG